MFELLLSNTKSVDAVFVPPAVVPGKLFQGFVPASELITGKDLATLVGLSSGTLINDDAGWLKYIEGSSTFYIARKNIRYGTTVAAYKAAQLIAGKTVTLPNGNRYRVRLLSGMSVNPFSSIISDLGGGDWNKYLYPLLNAANRPTADVWSYYTASDLGLAVPDTLADGKLGVISACKDQHNTISTAMAARGWDYRGLQSVHQIDRRTVINDASPGEGNNTGSLAVIGWRPMLEDLGPAPIPDLYLGEVTEAELISASALTTLVGLTAGSITNANISWLKFRYNNKIVYIAKKPIRHAMTYEALAALGITKGTKQFTIQGKAHVLRVPNGSLNDPTSYRDIQAGGSFNDLIYPVYGGVSLSQPEIQAYPRWAAFTDAELGLGTTKAAAAGGAGAMTWCNELITGGSNRLLRGYNDSDNAGNRQVLAGWYIAPSGTAVYAGWRPIIEEV